ncbi:MAG: DUF1934 domain-containing protein [Clostridia bacterium]|nr:DUF1934 domain-containing protein [Oscillospiraceae bacterium]MBR6747358.1 DUF1934 domain-containing protein [Clostridia bacterium]
MRKDVIITLKGVVSPENDEELMELITEGRLYRKNGSYFITYRESELTGMVGVTTTLKVEAGGVTVMRNGPMSTHMVFRQGEKHYGLYQLEGGEPMTIAVRTSRVRQTICDFGGDVEIDYSIEINNVPTAENKLRLNVREQVGVS